ncbi:hypothetical protein PPERSA_12368 [Pseudocohnilembus persalinus]|uniref:Transmembrane protein n=1 Tax=Pseudocohnilembus persalinus TaxID=266149 RepID=A0A0V0R8D1_PSEPJ|nr:hypothetical protein PPERSA_12368 [Pseudocohnilembus persalinus]|eukprot:KRX10747.1 hypothetical protein PPERSA_12368 [Pseudocohnilembus persalinus]
MSTTQQVPKKPNLKNPTININQLKQLEQKTGHIYEKGICKGQGNFNNSFGSGRSKYVILFVVSRFIFKFAWGIFDEISDWWYYIDAAKNDKFQDENLENLMVFFLFAQFGVQLIAWMIIFGELKIKDAKRNTVNIQYQISVITDSLFRKLTEKRRFLKKKDFDFSRFQDSNMVLDANIKPNLTTFLFETDLERYLRMADTIEAIFEALPMAILQFLNNQHIYGRVADWGLQNQLFFLSSFFTVLLYTITLIQNNYLNCNSVKKKVQLSFKIQNQIQMNMQTILDTILSPQSSFSLNQSTYKKSQFVSTLREVQLDLGYNRDLFEQINHKNNEKLKQDILVNYKILKHNKISLNLIDSALNVGERLNFIFEIINLNHSCELVSLDLRQNQINEINIEKLAHLKNIKYEYIVQFYLDFSQNQISKYGQAKVISLILSGFQKTEKVCLNFSNQEKCFSPKEIHEEDYSKQKKNSKKKEANYKIQAEPNSSTKLNQNNSNSSNNLATDDKQMVKYSQDLEQTNNQSSQFNIKLPQSHQLFLFLKHLTIEFENCDFQDVQLEELSTQVLFQLRLLKVLELNLGKNNITDEGLQKLGKHGISQLQMLQNLNIQVDSQKTNKITHNGIQQLVASIINLITNKLTEIEFDFRNNEGIKGTLFYQNRILFQRSKILEDNNIIKQIQNALASEGETINLQTIKLPSNVATQTNFSLKEQFWINFEQSHIIKPLYDEIKDTISISNIHKFKNKEKGVTFGRKTNETQPADFDFEKDHSVSKNQGILTHKLINNNENKYFYQCQAGFSNASSFRVAKKAYYQLFKHCIITLGRGQFQVTIEIGQIGKNDVVIDEQQQWQGRSSKNSYFWDWVDEQEQEVDSDVTINSDMLEQAEEEQTQLSDNQIQIKVSNPTETGKKVYQKFTLIENDAQMDQEPKDDEVYIYGQSITVGSNKNCGIVLNPSIYQDFLAEFHCYIGRKLLGNKNEKNRKQFWYIRVSDDIDVDYQETFLNMQRNHNNYEKRPIFPLYDNMEINLGFTVFKVNFQEKLQQQKEREREKLSKKQKKLESKSLLERKATRNII